MWKSLQEAFELDDPLDLGIAIEITDPLDADRAREVYAAACAEPGTAALILAAGCRHWLDDFDVALRVRDELALYEAAQAPFIELPSSDGIEAALARLARATGVDPLTILHRVDDESLSVLESDDDNGIDLDALAPDDPHEAYAVMRAAREAARTQRDAERARDEAENRGRDLGTLGMRFDLALSQGRTRTPDVASAIAELSPGNGARVIRLATTPARALLYIGFGGWNACPRPHQQARTWEHWASTHSAVPVVLGEDTLAGIVASPITSRDALVRFAREVVSYCSDSTIEGYLPLLAMSWRQASLWFWWD